MRPAGHRVQRELPAVFDVAFTELWRAAVGPWQEMVGQGVDAVVADANLSGRLRHVCLSTETWSKTDVPDWVRRGLRRFASDDAE